jgi:hypothetical protein
LVVIEGAALPERLIFQSAAYAQVNGLNIGDEKLILWDNNGTETYEGVTRPKYRYDVLSGGKYSDAFVQETAKVAAKAIAKFAPKFATLSQLTQPATAITTLSQLTQPATAITASSQLTQPATAIVNPAFMDIFEKEFDRISDIADDTADGFWATLRANIKAEEKKPENAAHSAWFSGIKSKIKDVTGVEA